MPIRNDITLHNIRRILSAIYRTLYKLIHDIIVYISHGMQAVRIQVLLFI